MGKAIFWSVPAHGDTMPLLGTLKELVQRGEEIIYYGNEEFREVVETTGAQFRTFKGEVTSIEFQLAETDFVGFLYSLLAFGLDKLIHNLDDARREHPTYVIHGCMCSWGKMLGQLLNIKSINLIHSAPMSDEDVPKGLHEVFSIFLPLLGSIIASTFNHNSLAAQYKRRFGIKVDWFDLATNLENLNVVYSPPFMTPELVHREPTWRFVGPSLYFKENKITQESFSFSRKVGKPLVYVSLGTIHSGNKTFIEKCVQAFNGKHYQVLCSVARKFSAKDFDMFPENFTVAEWVPQQTILARVDIFLTHAGMNSVNEGLYFGCPMLMFPHHIEQLTTAKRVKRLGCGEILDVHKVTPGELLRMTEKIIKTPSYKDQANHYSQVIQKYEEHSVNLAASAIIEYARS